MNINKEVIELRLDEIIPNRFQPREKFDEEGLNELAQSIREHGVINPVVVRKVGDKYEMVAGERRHKASMLAGKTTIPAIIADLDDFQSAEVALIENIQRKDLTPIEEARTYQTILRMGNITQDELAKRVSKTQPTIANKLRLLELDQKVQDALLEGKISERHARSLLNIQDKGQQVALLDEIINNRLTVREVDLKIKEILGGTDESNGGEELELIGVDEPTTPQNEEVPTASDIEKIKEQATNINQPEVDADMNKLLKPAVEPTPVVEENNQKENSNKFIPTFEEDTIQPPPVTMEPPAVEPTPVTPEPPVEEPTPVSNPIPETPKVDTFVTGDLRTVINTIRQCVNTIEKYGFKVDSEEFDFENMYQVIIKIDKK